MGETENLRFEDVCLARTIRRLRGERNLTLNAVADSMGLTYQQVQKFERAANRVTFSSFMRLAEALRCTPEQLLREVRKEMASAHGLDRQGADARLN